MTFNLSNVAPNLKSTAQLIKENVKSVVMPGSDIRRSAGNAIEQIAYNTPFLGNPDTRKDTGFSEFIAGVPTPKSRLYAQNQAGSIGVSGSWEPNPSPNNRNNNQNNFVPVNQNNSTDSLINEYLKKGWTDINAIKGDIANGGYRNWSEYNDIGNVDLEAQIRAEREKLINDTYSQNEDYLNKQESALGEAKLGEEHGVVDSFGLRSKQLGNYKESALNTLDQRDTTATRQKEDAMSQATRLYNELIAGSKQRFGGASSAGEASQAILGSEMQRQLGGIQRSYLDEAQNIYNQRWDMESSYQVGLEKLETEKSQAFRDIKNSYNQKILSIKGDRLNNLKWQSEQKLDALKEMASSIKTVNERAQAFQMELALNKQKMMDSFEYEVAMLKEKANYASTKAKSISWQAKPTDKGMYVFNPVNPNESYLDTAVGSINDDDLENEFLNWNGG